MTKRQRKRRRREAELTRRLVTRPKRLQRRLLQLMSEQDDLTIFTSHLEREFPCALKLARKAIIHEIQTLMAYKAVRVVPDGWQLTATAWLQRLGVSNEGVRP